MDQRYTPRLNMKNRVVCRLADNVTTLEAQTKDMSCSGACIHVDETFIPHEKLNLTIFLSEDQAVQVSAEVSWAKPNGFKNQVGFHFFNTTQKAQELILQHLLNMDKELVVGHWYDDWNTPSQSPPSFQMT